jgi:hypothetical protein
LLAPPLRDFAAPPERFAVDRLPDEDLRAPDERLEPPPDDFARVERDFVPPELERALLERERDEADLRAVDLRAVDLRALDLRVPPDLRARPRDDDDDPELVLPPELSSPHLPDSTRCAASATASAISEPNLVALAATLVAACCAVSAASSPASRIARRALGLALIAAAAAARPAASISLLIAALASLSTVLSFERERDEDFLELDLEELFRADFAIASSPSVA